ncbi:MAG: hypothetical protein IBV53_07360 [Candidatus Atribacteria bacterium]
MDKPVKLDDIIQGIEMQTDESASFSKISDILYDSIKGRGAFRRFKNNIYKYNLEEDWYRFRDEAIKQITIEWCEDNGINYIEE